METEYEFPAKRICPHCPGLTWEKHQLEEHSEHLRIHNATPAEWTEAYKRIQAGKERSKAAAKES